MKYSNSYSSAKKSRVTSAGRKDNARNRETRGNPKFGNLAAMAKKSGGLGKY